MKKHFQILDAVLTSPVSGVVELSEDWPGKSCPRLSFNGAESGFESLLPLAPEAFGRTSGYCRTDAGEILFILPWEFVENAGLAESVLYVAGSFNGWSQAVGQESWALSPSELNGRRYWLCACDLGILEVDETRQFKFVTSDHRWLPVAADADGAVLDGEGNRNLRVDLGRTGHHRFGFVLKSAPDLSAHHEIELHCGEASERRTLRPGAFFHQMRSDLPMGAVIDRTVPGDRTYFRLFAPRAKWVRVGLFESLEQADAIAWYPLDRLEDGAWETTIPGNLHGCYYWFRLDGPQDEFGHFDPNRNILDPYAWATVSREGPGIVLDPDQIERSSRSFSTPQWQDLVVVESHVRDLVAHAPILLDESARRGFSGLRQWVEHAGFYLKRLGANAIELQPIQEFDNENVEEYHWGYMPVNLFSPESSYGTDPRGAAQVCEFVELVEAFHRNGIAVLIDVVYNHVGLPSHLLAIDKLYYFELAGDASLMNWSGCGNDLRCAASMVSRLIRDSLVHMIEFYGVDGFRFDLAELIGTKVLRELEAALKAVKPDVILIAEPWSFRGHIAGELRDTGFSSWNDGYRNFLRDYVRGEATAETAGYYLRGSPWHFARWPAQTVNYVESHDDRTWIDVITENESGDGSDPTRVDIQRSHLMIAFLMASLGIPMLHAGQDFLSSKAGDHNTYQKGERNALDYRRIFQFPGTHRYFRDWIRFRLSPWGELIRLFSAPAEGYFSVTHVAQGTGMAVVYNADGSLGPRRLLFAINPEQIDIRIPLDDRLTGGWTQLADQERFESGGIDTPFPIDGEVFLPALGCGLWVAGEEG